MFTPELIGIFLYLALQLAFGLMVSRSIKTQDDYLLAGRQVAADALRQPDMRDRFVAYRMTTNIDGVTLAQTGLIDAGTRPTKLLLRRWGDEA